MMAEFRAQRKDREYGFRARDFVAPRNDSGRPVTLRIVLIYGKMASALIRRAHL
jgi:hypothetical protein